MQIFLESVQNFTFDAVGHFFHIWLDFGNKWKLRPYRLISPHCGAAKYFFWLGNFYFLINVNIRDVLASISFSSLWSCSVKAPLWAWIAHKVRAYRKNWLIFQNLFLSQIFQCFQTEQILLLIVHTNVYWQLKANKFLRP